MTHATSLSGYLVPLVLCLAHTEIGLCQSLDGGTQHSLYLCTDGSASAIGGNAYGQLGNGTANGNGFPAEVINLTNVRCVSACTDHSLFLRSDGTVWSCGKNLYGQLGDGSSVDRNAVVQVIGLTNIIAIAAGGDHSVFLRDDGTVWACGKNSTGQLGNGSTTDQSIPVQVTGLSGVSSIAAGGAFSLFLLADGTTRACGYNLWGQLGDGTTTNRSTPVQVIGVSNVSHIGAGWRHSLFVKADGTVWGCGDNVFGQLGDGNSGSLQPTVVQASGLDEVVAVAGGWGHSTFLASDGTVWACGANNGGQIGDGTTFDRHTPVAIGILNGIVHIGAGSFESYATNGLNTWAWGDEWNSDAPITVPGLCALEVNVHDGLVPSQDLLWPTPSLGPVEVRCSISMNSPVTLSVSDDLGRVVQQKHFPPSRTGVLRADLSALPSGHYILTVSDGSNAARFRTLRQ